ncbi:MAG: hypothetical protein MJA31_07490, partial [Clostridia bacterium]|nr:hypothetical protein [Clostridia bacterium]
DIIPDYNSANPEDLVIEEEKYNTKKEMLNEYLKLLTDLEKKILKEYLMGKSYREIALSVGCHTKSVDNALARIKRKTRENKEEYLEIVL